MHTSALIVNGYDPGGTAGEEALTILTEKLVLDISFAKVVLVERSPLIEHSIPVPSSPEHPIIKSIGFGLMFPMVHVIEPSAPGTIIVSAGSQFRVKLS